VIAAIAMFPQKSFAGGGFPAWAPGWGAETAVNGTAEDGGGFNAASSTGTVGTANASLVTGDLSASAGLTGSNLDGFDQLGSYAAAEMWDEVTTGAVAPGSTMTLTLNGVESLSSFSLLDAAGVEEGALLDLTVDKGSQSNEWAFADERISFQDPLVAQTSVSTLGFDGVNVADEITSPSWLGTISTTFDVAPDTTYLVYVSAGASVSWDYDLSGDPGNVVASVDPIWSLSTSGGYTYTTASGLPFGGNGSSAAPEPSSVALLLPFASGILCGVRARRRRSQA
jgi:hypothetical protein